MLEAPEDTCSAIARLQAELRAARLRLLAETLASLGQPCRQVLVQYRLDEITALPWLTALLVPGGPGHGPAEPGETALELLERLHDLPVFDELLWLLHEDYDPELDTAHGVLTYALPPTPLTPPHSGAVTGKGAPSGARSPRPAGGP